MRKQPQKIYLAVDDNGEVEQRHAVAGDPFPFFVWHTRADAMAFVRLINASDPCMPALRVVTYAIVEAKPKRKAMRR